MPETRGSKMTDALRNALKAGGVAGAGLLGVIILAALVLGPAVVALGWHLDWWSFEAAVIVLLLTLCYVTGWDE